MLAAIAVEPAEDSRNQGCLIANPLVRFAAFDGKRPCRCVNFAAAFGSGLARALRADCVPRAERRAHLLGALFWGASTEIRWDDSARTLAPLDEGLGRQVDQWQPEGRQRQ